MRKFVTFVITAAAVSLMANQPSTVQSVQSKNNVLVAKPGMIRPIIQAITPAWVVDSLRVNNAGSPTAIIGHNATGYRNFSPPKVVATTVLIDPASQR